METTEVEQQEFECSAGNVLWNREEILLMSTSKALRGIQCARTGTILTAREDANRQTVLSCLTCNGVGWFKRVKTIPKIVYGEPVNVIVTRACHTCLASGRITLPVDRKTLSTGEHYDSR